MHRKYPSKIIATLLLIFATLIHSPAQAIPSKFALEIGTGLHGLGPYTNIRINHRLPLMKDRLGVFFGVTPYSGIIAGATGIIGQGVRLGGRYYFTEQGHFLPYGLVGAGVEFSLSETALPDGSSLPPGFIGSPMLYTGIGFDWFWSKGVGLNGQIAGGIGGADYFGNNFMVRPEINLKFAF